jgi:Protein of unknown function (DUF2924)
MTVAAQTKTIEGLKGAALRKKFHEVVGVETKSNNRAYLVKRIVEKLQAQIASDAVSPTASSAKNKRDDRDARLPAVGTILEREHDGKKVKVKVLDEGFEFQGKTYGSLSTIANEVTGTSWNGFLFFRLVPYGSRLPKAESRAKI